MRIDLVLKNGQSGYDAVWQYIEKYWKQNGYATAIVSLETSYDGREYRRENEVVSPTEDFQGCEFLNDWWEGEEYIRLIGIINVHEIDIFHTADVVAVVRCKDCKFNVANMEKDEMCINDYSGEDIVCSYFMTDGLEPKDYCSRGERRSENEG